MTKKQLERALKENMGEAIHTAFRKGGGGLASQEIWCLIEKMPPEEWRGVTEWVAWSLSECIDFSMWTKSDQHSSIILKKAAVALGRKGGKKGGPARAAALTPKQRSESARKAVQARWARAKT